MSTPNCDVCGNIKGLPVSGPSLDAPGNRRSRQGEMHRCFEDLVSKETGKRMILTKEFTDIGSFSVNHNNKGLFSHVHQPISDDGMDF